MAVDVGYVYNRQDENVSKTCDDLQLTAVSLNKCVFYVLQNKKLHQSGCPTLTRVRLVQKRSDPPKVRVRDSTLSYHAHCAPASCPFGFEVFRSAHMSRRPLSVTCPHISTRPPPPPSVISAPPIFTVCSLLLTCVFHISIFNWLSFQPSTISTISTKPF